MTVPDIALICFFLLLISWGSRCLPFIPLLCLLFGIGWGFFGPRHSIIVLETIAKVALTFFLFIDGARLHIPKILHFHSKRLSSIGLVVTLILGILLMRYFFQLTLEESFLATLPLLIIDGKTTPSAFSSMLPTRIQQMVNLEGSFTGVFAFFLLSLVHLSHPFHFFIGIFFPILTGVGLGYICGLVAKTALDTGRGDYHLLRGALFLIPYAIFAFCELFDSNGFIGVIAAGLTFGHFARPLCNTLFDLARRQGTYLYYLLVIFFGVFSLHVFSQTLTVPLILFSLIFLFGVRFIAVLASFFKTPYRWKTIGYFTFMSPKGLIPIATTMLFTEYYTFPAQNLMLQIVVTTLFLSLLIHSLFASPIVHFFGSSLNRQTDSAEYLPTVSLPL